MTGPANQILVIEAGDTTTRLLNNNLTLFPGYQIFTADTASKALELLEVFRFDLVNLDLPLSDMDPNRFLAKLAELNSISPVIVTLDSDACIDLKVNTRIEAVAKDSLSPALHLNLIHDCLQSYLRRVEQSQSRTEKGQDYLKASSALIEHSGQQLETTKLLLESFLETVADKVKRTLPAHHRTTASFEKRRLTILVASNDVLIRRWFSQVLKSVLKQRVILASSVGEALRITREIKPDIVFTELTFDWERQDGVYLAEEVKKRYPETYIVVVNGFSEPGSNAINLTVPKPVSARQIKSIISSYQDALAAIGIGGTKL